MVVSFWIGFGVDGRTLSETGQVGSLQRDAFGDLMETTNGSAKLNRSEDASGRLLLKVDAQNNDGDDDEGDDALPRINMALYNKAKTFGQSPEERRKVAETLQRLDLLVKSKMKVVTTDFEGKTHQIATDGDRKSDRVSNARQRDFVPKTVAFYRTLQNGKKYAGRFRDSDHNTVHTPEEFGSHFEGDIVLQANKLKKCTRRRLTVRTRGGKGNS